MYYFINCATSEVVIASLTVDINICRDVKTAASARTHECELCDHDGEAAHHGNESIHSFYVTLFDSRAWHEPRERSVMYLLITSTRQDHNMHSRDRLGARGAQDRYVSVYVVCLPAAHALSYHLCTSGFP